jgi:hypothetical protein
MEVYQMINVKKNHFVSLTVIAVLFAIISTFSFTITADSGTPYVLVILKNKERVKLEYESFTFNWELPIIVKSQETCDNTEITKDQLDEIYVISEFYNNCDDKDDWEVDVYLKDGRQILGYLKVTEYNVKGNHYATGEEKTIPFKDIKKVVFRK